MPRPLVERRKKWRRVSIVELLFTVHLCTCCRSNFFASERRFRSPSASEGAASLAGPRARKRLDLLPMAQFFVTVSSKFRITLATMLHAASSSAGKRSSRGASPTLKSLTAACGAARKCPSCFSKTPRSTAVSRSPRQSRRRQAKNPARFARRSSSPHASPVPPNFPRRFHVRWIIHQNKRL